MLYLPSIEAEKNSKVTIAKDIATGLGHNVVDTVKQIPLPVAGTVVAIGVNIAMHDPVAAETIVKPAAETVHALAPQISLETFLRVAGYAPGLALTGIFFVAGAANALNNLGSKAYRNQVNGQNAKLMAGLKEMVTEEILEKHKKGELPDIPLDEKTKKPVYADRKAQVEAMIKAQTQKAFAEHPQRVIPLTQKEITGKDGKKQLVSNPMGIFSEAMKAGAVWGLSTGVAGLCIGDIILAAAGDSGIGWERAVLTDGPLAVLAGYEIGEYKPFETIWKHTVDR